MNRAAPSANSLPVIRPDWPAPARVAALCTTRAGGVSESPWDSLNLGLHVGDEAAHVQENRRRLVAAAALPSPPVWLSQVHGERVVHIGDVLPASPPEADGAWTDVPGRVIGVMTADCLPVVITDAAGGRVAVAHAGWRGLAGGVLASALASFPPDAALHVWLGPAIGPTAFEVGAEVREAFLARDGAHASAFLPGKRPGKYVADLYALARTALQRERDATSLHVSGGEHCTLTEATRFHSHRRDGVHSGRMATLAWIRPTPIAG